MDLEVIDGIAVPSKSSALVLNLVSQFKVLANSAGPVSHSLEGGGRSRGRYFREQWSVEGTSTEGGFYG